VSAKSTIACDPGSARRLAGRGRGSGSAPEETTNANSEITVVLSNHFARFILVPWSQSLGNAEEETAFVRYCFAKVHGERSKAWEVRLSPAPTGSTRIASAIDSSLMQAVRAAFPAGARAKLVSVQPYLMSAFNRWRKQVGGERAWFLLVEPQRACLTRLEGGRWSSVRIPGNFDEPSQWRAARSRAARVGGGGRLGGRLCARAPKPGTPSTEALGGLSGASRSPRRKAWLPRVGSVCHGALRTMTRIESSSIRRTPAASVVDRRGRS